MDESEGVSAMSIDKKADKIGGDGRTFDACDTEAVDLVGRKSEGDSLLDIKRSALEKERR